MLEFIKREDYINKDRNEVMTEFQKYMEEYDAYIKDMNVEQCKEEEKRLVAIMNDIDKATADAMYTLPKSCTFKGSVREITRKMIGEYICELLDKVECEYQYTLGYYELYMWWKDPKSEISYNNLNSTLQVLGNNMRFRGPHQWQMILSINEYFKPLHNAYVVDNMILHLYGTCHSHLLDKMKIDNPIEPEAQPLQQQEHVEEEIDGVPAEKQPAE